MSTAAVDFRSAPQHELPVDRVASLVAAARDGDPTAWEDLIACCEPMVISITRKFRLSAADSDDVRQTVWVKLVRHLPQLREPRAMRGWWIAIITRNVCLEVVTSQRRTVPLDPQAPEATFEQPRNGLWAELSTDVPIVDDLHRQACGLAVRQGLAELAPAQRDLLLILAADPPPPYRQVSRQLGIPLGSIGPTRARALKKLRNTAPVRRLVDGPLSLANRPAA